ncbi:MAG: hypothetical protein J3R72DRAFT_493795 [Linnemannia gamsii]|nr:MAG: hypothetical protein J3R72DRAFT_493795 [Linnemannia gamsii]
MKPHVLRDHSGTPRKILLFPEASCVSTFLSRPGLQKHLLLAHQGFGWSPKHIRKMQGGVSGSDVTKIIPPAPEPIPGLPGDHKYQISSPFMKGKHAMEDAVWPSPGDILTFVCSTSSLRTGAIQFEKAARDTCGIKGNLLQGLIQQLAPEAQVPACEENVHSSIFICKKDRGNSWLRLGSSLTVLIAFNAYCNNCDRIQSREAKASILGRLSDWANKRINECEKFPSRDSALKHCDDSNRPRLLVWTSDVLLECTGSCASHGREGYSHVFRDQSSSIAHGWHLPHEKIHN